MINTNERKSHSDLSHIAINPQHRDEDLQSFTTSLISRPSISGSLSGSVEISQEHIEQIHDAFAIFDREMTGSITTEQFSKVLEDLGYHVPEAELVALVNQLDTDKSGTIEFEEYLSFMLTFIRKNLTTEDNLRDAFRLFDQDDDGFIGPSDLRNILNNLGEKVTDEDIDEMIREADLDKDFKVNFYEFQRVMNFR